MKFKLLALALLVSGVSATAQNPYIAPLCAMNESGAVVVSNPQTVLAVDITTRTEKIVAGPYARYAQKFLGVRAPLTDKLTSEIVNASVALADGKSYYASEAPKAANVDVTRHAVCGDDFPHMQIDKQSMSVLALEDAARDAATTIYALRHHRMELITGEAGENVFGEGLKSALDEIARQEQAYLELFLGKRVVTTATSRYEVCPETDKKQYVVARFSASAGLLPENDLSGDMVVLQIEPSPVGRIASEADPKERNVITCRVAAPSVCRVLSGGKEFFGKSLPIFEYGRNVNVVRVGNGK